MREKDVLGYLRDNPRFFRRHLSELTRMLRLSERDVVDLTGRQLVTLRDENTRMRRQLHSWYKNAANNEAIVHFLHRLAIHLVKDKLKPGRTAKLVSRELRNVLKIELCKLCDLADAHLLSTGERQRLDASNGALRTTLPLAGLKNLTARGGDWVAYLYVPVYRGRKLRAVIVCATRTARDFPHAAATDYAISMAELVGAALEREG